MTELDKFIVDPNNRFILEIIKSMKNGIWYGGRLRFAHSLVINFIFKRNVPLSKRLNSILKLTKDHSMILAIFASIYKVIKASLDSVFAKDKPIHEFLAGLISGALVYGNQTKIFNKSITHQITLYCAARVVLGFGKLLAYKIAKLSKDNDGLKNLILKFFTTDKHLDKKLLRSNIQKQSWTVFASLTWGLVMYLHRYYPSFLQHGLESSMVYIYDDNNWTDFRSFLGF